MEKPDLQTSRKELMELMNKSDDFFREFGLLDDKAYADGAISKKDKELCMIAISIVTKCEACIGYHIEESIKTGANKNELIEAIKMGMMASGSTSYPYVRIAFGILKKENII